LNIVFRPSGSRFHRARNENLEAKMSLVLIVDDQPGIRDLLIVWISREGYQTAQAADAETALDEMILRPADVVFCDVQMPGRGGFWLADRLRERFPETAIVLATGDGNVPPVISLKEGVVEYLVKPFSREGVLKAVRLALEWHQMSLAVRAKKNDRTDSIEEWLSSPKRTASS
jgi:DNA-binding NtrC family response regulator